MRYFLVLGLILLSGCTSVMFRTPDDPTAMSIIEARRTIREVTNKPDVLGSFYAVGLGSAQGRVTNIQVSKEGKFIFISSATPKPGYFYSCNETGNPAVNNLLGSSYVIFWMEGFPQDTVCLNSVRVTNEDDAWRLAQALFILKRVAMRDPKVKLEDPASAAAFEEVVRKYRSQPVPAALPEQARSYRIQAETAVDTKRYDDAVHFYERALAEAPWWADGYFNKALVLAERGYRDEAIISMRRYLRLAPNTPDARAAQDKIYHWQGELGR